jgi:hypothetical protein
MIKHDITIAYDVDGVCLDFTKQLFLFYNKEYPGIESITDWDLSKFLPSLNFRHFNGNKEFWLTMQRFDKSLRIIKPVCYLTARSSNPDWTHNCLIANGFPDVPVYNSKDKLKFMEENNIDILVDDKPGTFHIINDSDTGKRCILYDAPYNRHIQTTQRIKSLEDLIAF